MAEVATILGTISACVDLADRISKLISRYGAAQKRIYSIASDVSLLQSITNQLKGILRPDPNADYTAARFSSEALRTTLTAVQRCEKACQKVIDGLNDVLAKSNSKDRDRLQYDDQRTIDWATKTYWIFKEDSIRELRDELGASKEAVMISLSLNQLTLAKQPAQLHPLTQRELDQLKVMVEVLYSRSQNPAQASTSGVVPLTGMIPPGGSAKGDPMFATGGSSDALGPAFKRDRIDRIPRVLVSTDVLDRKRIRWLNDPFDPEYINIHATLSDVDFMTLIQSGPAVPGGYAGRRIKSTRIRDDAKKKESVDSDTRAERESIERDYEMRRMKEREEEEMAKRKLYDAKLREEQRPSNALISNLPVFDPTEDIVEQLISRWTAPAPSNSDRTLKPSRSDRSGRCTSPSNRSTRSSECTHKFDAGETMYFCWDCTADDGVVFCADCFKSADHKGHRKKTEAATGGEEYCDCGHKGVVRQTVTCVVHGAFDARGPLER